MTPQIEARASQVFDRLPRPVQAAVLIVLVGLILFLAIALESGGDAPFMYATF